MITVALNEKGEFVHVDDARKGQSYRCPRCKVPLTPRHCTSCRSHYRVKGGKHKFPSCMSLDKSKNVAREIACLNNKQLFGHLNRKPGPPGGGGGGGPKLPPSHEEKTLGPANLEQLLGLGAELMDPDSKILNDKPLHTILIRHQDMERFYSKNVPFGNRVLELCPHSAVDARILFTARIGGMHQAYFSLYVPDEELYSKLMMQIFATFRGAHNGNCWESPKIRRIFVMAKWDWAQDATWKIHTMTCDRSRVRIFMQEAILNRKQDLRWLESCV